MPNPNDRECRCGFDRLDCSHPLCWSGRSGLSQTPTPRPVPRDPAATARTVYEEVDAEIAARLDAYLAGLAPSARAHIEADERRLLAARAGIMHAMLTAARSGARIAAARDAA